jgi:hypothetical protein
MPREAGSGGCWVSQLSDTLSTHVLVLVCGITDLTLGVSG